MTGTIRRVAARPAAVLIGTQKNHKERADEAGGWENKGVNKQATLIMGSAPVFRDDLNIVTEPSLI